MLQEEKLNFSLHQQHLLHALEPVISRDLLSGDYASLYETLDQQIKLHKTSWQQLTIYNNFDKQIYPLETVNKLQGQYFIYTHQEIRLKNSIVGYVNLTTDWSQQYKKTRSYIIQLELIVLSITAILSLSGVLIQTVWIRNPLISLKESTSHLIRGNFDTEIPHQGEDEIGSLAQAFEKMRKALKESQIKLVSALGEAQQSEARQRIILETVADAIITINENGIIEKINPATEAMFNYSAEQLLGKNITILMPDNLKHKHTAGLEKYKNTGITNIIGKRIELMSIRSNGEIFPISLAINETTIQDKKYFTALLRDITLEQQHHQELITAKEDAEQAAKIKSEFLAAMSHEIRTPMNGVLGMAEILSKTKLDPQQQEYLDIINESGKSLLNIINDILDFSKIEANKLELDFNIFDLEYIVYEIAQLLSPSASHKNIELILRYDKNCAKYYYGDVGRIRQIFINLIGNAVKFTTKGYVLIDIHHETGRKTGNILVKIQDTGIGIDIKNNPDLFHSFTQADYSSTRTVGGTGLGLAISHKLVELMGGEIGVESVLGEGSTFWFTLDIPIHQKTEELPKTDLTGSTVLIINDNSINQTIMHEQLTRVGMLVEHASSAKQVERLLIKAIKDHHHYNVAILDYPVFDSDCDKLVSIIKQHNSLADLPLVLLTSSSQRGDALHFKTVGFTAFLTKPVYSETLYKTLSVILTRASKNLPQEFITKYSIDEIRKHEVFSHTYTANLLLVEDNTTNQLVAIAQLQDLGLNVTIANNGIEAIDYWKNNTFDLILMDIQMPKMDGYESTKLIRKYEQDNIRIPIIALTANALESDRNEAMKSGMDDFISKPYTQEDIQTKLEKWLPSACILKKQKTTEAEPYLYQESEISHLNSKTISQLESLMGEKYKLFINDFISNTSNKLFTLSEAIKNNDTDSLYRTCHSLKGISGTIGAESLAELSLHLEQLAKKGTISGADILLKDIEISFDGVKKQLLQTI